MFKRESFHSTQLINAVLREFLIKINPRRKGRPDGVIFAGIFFENVQDLLELFFDIAALEYDGDDRVGAR